MQTKVKGFKAMNPDMTCRGFQFKVGETFKHDGEVIPCNSGFHFCQDIKDIEGYYEAGCRIFEVEASCVIVEDRDKTVTDTLTIVREVDYNDYINHSSAWIRRVVANKGIGLDVLLHDSNTFVRYEVSNHSCLFDTCINDKSSYIRENIASKGYGLDRLIHDQDPDVRAQVVRQGYGLDILVNDQCWVVRREVAERGYGIDKLIHDKDPDVRVAARAWELRKLKNAKPNS